jgi:hypothetical protein
MQSSVMDLRRSQHSVECGRSATGFSKIRAQLMEEHTNVDGRKACEMSTLPTTICLMLPSPKEGIRRI